MTNKLLTVFKVGVVILFLVAIGLGGWIAYTRFFSDSETTEGPDDDTSDKVDLVWWTLWEDENDMQIIADTYSEKNPNVNIEIKVQNIEINHKESVKSQISDNDPNTGADIIRIHNTWVPMLRRYLSPMPEDTMSKTEYTDTFYTTASEDLIANDGEIYAIPMMFDGLGVYYNKDLLKEAGYTIPEDNWDDFVIQAKALTETDDTGSIKIAGAGIGASRNIDFSFDILSLLILQEGATITDNSGKVTFANDTKQKAAKAIKRYTDFVTRYEVWDRQGDRDIQMFTEGRLAMMFAPSWRALDINTTLETYNESLNYDIAPVPQYPGLTDEHIKNWATYWAESVSGESEHPEIAWDFLKFVTEPDQLITFYNTVTEDRSFGEIYPRKDMSDKLISEKYVGAYIKMAPTAHSWRMANKEAVEEIFDTLIKNIVEDGGWSVGAIHSQLGNIAIEIEQIIADSST